MKNEGTSWTWETAPESPGAGVVVVRKVNGKYLVLGLWCRGGYDIPKGHVENDESFFEAAIRETKEESDIIDLRFKWGNDFKIIDNLVIYLGETKQKGKIVENEETGIFEHEYLKWLDWEEMHENTYNYLKPAIIWAKKKIAGNDD